MNNRLFITLAAVLLISCGNSETKRETENFAKNLSESDKKIVSEMISILEKNPSCKALCISGLNNGVPPSDLVGIIRGVDHAGGEAVAQKIIASLLSLFSMFLSKESVNKYISDHKDELSSKCIESNSILHRVEVFIPGKGEKELYEELSKIDAKDMDENSKKDLYKQAVETKDKWETKKIESGEKYIPLYAMLYNTPIGTQLRKIIKNQNLTKDTKDKWISVLDKSIKRGPNIVVIHIIDSKARTSDDKVTIQEIKARLAEDGSSIKIEKEMLDTILQEVKLDNEKAVKEVLLSNLTVTTR